MFRYEGERLKGKDISTWSRLHLNHKNPVLIIISWSIRNSFLCPCHLSNVGWGWKNCFHGKAEKTTYWWYCWGWQWARRTEERPGIAVWFPWTGDAWTFPLRWVVLLLWKESFEEPILRGCYVTKNLPLMCKILLMSHSNSTVLHHPGLVFYLENEHKDLYCQADMCRLACNRIR